MFPRKHNIVFWGGMGWGGAGWGEKRMHMGNRYQGELAFDRQEGGVISDFLYSLGDEGDSLAATQPLPSMASGLHDIHDPQEQKAYNQTNILFCRGKLDLAGLGVWKVCGKSLRIFCPEFRRIWSRETIKVNFS